MRNTNCRNLGSPSCVYLCVRVFYGTLAFPISGIAGLWWLDPAWQRHPIFTGPSLLLLFPTRRADDARWRRPTDSGYSPAAELRRSELRCRAGLGARLVWYRGQTSRYHRAPEGAGGERRRGH